jgi:transposase
VLLVDLVESVRLMQEHEDYTVRRWAEFVRIVDTQILPRYDGVMVKSLGDGLLTRFETVPDAVNAAAEMHRTLATQNAALPEDQHFHLRAGVNAAMAWSNGIDYYGTGVNLAARLANLAVAPVGRRGVEQLLEVVADTADRRLPEAARACLAALGSQLRALKVQILEFDRRIVAWHRSSATSRRLDAIPGVGPALATALVASVADANAFRSGRDFSAWVGLVPKQNSSGGKDKLGSISKQGDRYLRSLFTAGALAVIRYAKIHGTGHRPWLTALLARRPTKVAAIALANKLARMAWAMMARSERYKEPAALTA